MESKFVSVIIPTYRDWRRLSLCLDALAKQTYPQELFEVIVINNDPIDMPPKDFLLPTGYQLLVEEKAGSYAARNTGLRVAKGEIIAFTDADCIPEKDWIKNAIKHFNENKTSTRIGGNILVFCKSEKPSIVELFNNVYSFPQKFHVEVRGTCVTANLFVYKYLFDKVGYFDEKLLSMGDYVWARLAGSAGYTLEYCEDVIVRHPVRSFSELVKKERRLGGAEGTFPRKNLSKIKGSPLYIFLRSLKLRGYELEFLEYQGKGLGSTTKLSLLAIKYYLIVIRAYERMRVQMGKKPHRE